MCSLFTYFSLVMSTLKFLFWLQMHLLYVGSLALILVGVIVYSLRPPPPPKLKGDSSTSEVPTTSMVTSEDTSVNIDLEGSQTKLLSVRTGEKDIRNIKRTNNRSELKVHADQEGPSLPKNKYQNSMN